MNTVPVSFKYNFSDLGVSPVTLEKLMGFEPGKSPDPIPGIIASSIADANNHADIQGGYIITDSFCTDTGLKKLSVQDQLFETGRLVTHQMKSARKIALFIITAGKGFESWSKDLMQEGDPMSGYIADLLGSETVETAAEKMLAQLESTVISEMGYKTSNPYSPGYCGWPITDQFKLFSFFPDNFSSISLSETALMHPVKSISGIVAIGDHVKKEAHGCQVCDATNCLYRGKRD